MSKDDHRDLRSTASIREARDTSNHRDSVMALADKRLPTAAEAANSLEKLGQMMRGTPLAKQEADLLATRDSHGIHVMLDLEMLDLKPTAAIMQIGLVSFDPRSEDPVISTLEVDVAVDSAILAGATVGLSTIRWWQSQSEEIKAGMCISPVHIARALKQVTDWLAAIPNLRGIWSHGAATDIPMLAHSFHLLGREVPWSYQAPRDTRTVHAMARSVGWELPKREGGTKHNALGDALDQVSDLVDALTYIDLREM